MLTIMTSLSVLWILADWAEASPRSFLLAVVLVVWIACGLVTVLAMADIGKRKAALPLFNRKWVRIVAFLFPAGFWLFMMLRILVCNVILDGTDKKES